MATEYIDAWVPGWTPDVGALLMEIGFSDAVGKAPGKSRHLAAYLTGNVPQEARKALDAGINIVYAGGGAESAVRAACETFEVDILWNPHEGSLRDLLDVRAGGLDDATLTLMREHEIALGFTLASFLSTPPGWMRAQWLGRVRQNARLARKAKVPVIVASGAQDEWGLRAPRELEAFGILAGLMAHEARFSVSRNPSSLLQKAVQRADPSVVLKGLRVESWGDEATPKKKRLYGYY